MVAVSLPAAPPLLYEEPALAALTGGALRPGGVTLTRELLTCCRPAPGARVLDVGCGSGHSLAVLADEFGLEHDTHIQSALGKRVNGFWGIEALVAPPVL